MASACFSVIPLGMNQAHTQLSSHENGGYIKSSKYFLSFKDASNLLCVCCNEK